MAENSVKMVKTKIKMPDGSFSYMSHPDNWTDAQIDAAIPEMHAANQENPTEQSESQNEHDAAVRYGIKDPLVGLLNFGSRGGTATQNLGIELHNKLLGRNVPKVEATDFSEMLGIPKEKNLGDTLAQFAGEVAPALLAPETEIPWVSKALMKLPAWGKYLKTGLGNAVTQGGIAASQSPEDQGTAALKAGSIAAPFSMLSEAIKSGNPTIRNIGRGLGAVGAGGLGYYGAKGIGAPEPAADVAGLLGLALGGRGGNSERRIRENMLKGVNGTDYQDVLNAGERLGVHTRPSEASANPYTAGMEAGIGKSPQGSQELYEAGQKSLSEQEKSIEDLFGNIFPKSLEKEKNKLYEIAEKEKIPESILKGFKENEVFKQALRKVRTDPVYQQELKGVPENSIEYINQVKRAMDTMRFSEKDSTRAGIIKNTTNKVLETLDTISPKYKEGRQLAERGIVRREIEDLFNKKDETGTNLFKTVLSNKRDYNDLQNKFKRLEETASTPEQVKSMKSAQQQLEDMKLVFGRLIPTPTARTASALGRQNAAKEGSLTGTAKQYLHKLLHSDKYDVAAVRLITNPKWADEMDKLGEITSKDKLIAAFHNLLGKAAGQTITQ
jgi:hypothetical protein